MKIITLCGSLKFKKEMMETFEYVCVDFDRFSILENENNYKDIDSLSVRTIIYK